MVWRISKTPYAGEPPPDHTWYIATAFAVDHWATLLRENIFGTCWNSAQNWQLAEFACPVAQSFGGFDVVSEALGGACEAVEGVLEVGGGALEDKRSQDNAKLAPKLARSKIPKESEGPPGRILQDFGGILEALGYVLETVEGVLEVVGGALEAKASQDNAKTA